MIDNNGKFRWATLAEQRYAGINKFRVISATTVITQCSTREEALNACSVASEDKRYRRLQVQESAGMDVDGGVVGWIKIA
jgi:hypothetical protein